MFLCLAPFGNLAICHADAPPTKTYVVTANQAVVYEDFSLSSAHLFTLKHKAEIEIELEDEKPKEYAGDSFVFFRVISDEKQGFIISDMVVPKTKFLTTLPKCNAQTNGKAKVYFLQDGKYVESDITLPKNNRIFLYQGFDSKKQFNAVAFVYENEVVYGFLKESVINPDGVNPVLITIACFAIAAIGIILAFVFMKRKKRKTGISKKKSH